MIGFGGSRDMPFQQLVGHRHVLTMLARAVARDSLPPALIFAGPPGVGKFATAIALAEALNCEAALRGPAAAPFDADACGRCRPCRQIAQAAARAEEGAPSALDCLLVLAPDDRGSIKVDPVRAAIERCGYRPLDGRRRVAVVDQADALEVAAQNALLKILEEPPSSTTFVLVTARADALLATIRSRCPRLRFGPLSAADVEAALVRDRGVPPDEARQAASLSHGSLGAAADRLGGTADQVRGVALAVLAQAARSDSPASRLGAAKVLVSKAAEERSGRKKSGDGVSRAVLAERLEAIGTILRDVQVVSSRADGRWLASADLAADVAALAGVFDPSRVARAFAAVDRARAALDRNASPKVVADWLALQL
jgi:DNA polymerase-3 subunit delta'